MPQPDQQHPQETRDREIINKILQGEPTPENMAELARLRIRYYNFPGARSVQQDLNSVLQNWRMTEEELFAETRRLHATGQVYSRHGENKEDWS